MNKHKIKLTYNCPRNDRTYKGFLWIRVHDNDSFGTFIQGWGESNNIVPRWVTWEELETMRSPGGELDGKDWSSTSCQDCHDMRKFKKFLRKHPDLIGKCTLVHTCYYADESLGYSLDVKG